MGGLGVLVLGTAVAVYFLARGDVVVRATSAEAGPKPNARGLEIRF